MSTKEAKAASVLLEEDGEKSGKEIESLIQEAEYMEIISALTGHEAIRDPQMQDMVRAQYEKQADQDLMKFMDEVPPRVLKVKEVFDYLQKIVNERKVRRAKG